VGSVPDPNTETGDAGGRRDDLGCAPRGRHGSPPAFASKARPVRSAQVQVEHGLLDVDRENGCGGSDNCKALQCGPHAASCSWSAGHGRADHTPKSCYENRPHTSSCGSRARAFCGARRPGAYVHALQGTYVARGLERRPRMELTDPRKHFFTKANRHLLTRAKVCRQPDADHRSLRCPARQPRERPKTQPLCMTTLRLPPPLVASSRLAVGHVRAAAPLVCAVLAARSQTTPNPVGPTSPPRRPMDARVASAASATGVTKIATRPTGRFPDALP